MSLSFEFGTRAKPIGNLEQDFWLKQKPSWKQTRGIEVAEACASGQECGEVDAIWTSALEIPVAVTTADCVPLLFYRKDEQAVAAVHAGWQGTYGRIVPNFFAKLPPHFNNPHDWAVTIGPSIRACCYEFGEDLLEKFYTRFVELPKEVISPSSRKLDLIAILKHEIALLGVEIESIHPECTYCTFAAPGELKYFSYRRGDRNSRQYSLIWKR